MNSCINCREHAITGGRYCEIFIANCRPHVVGATLDTLNTCIYISTEVNARSAFANLGSKRTYSLLVDLSAVSCVLYLKGKLLNFNPFCAFEQEYRLCLKQKTGTAILFLQLIRLVTCRSTKLFLIHGLRMPAKIVINTTSVCCGKSRLAGQLFVHLCSSLRWIPNLVYFVYLIFSISLNGNLQSPVNYHFRPSIFVVTQYNNPLLFKPNAFISLFFFFANLGVVQFFIIQ
jgi:hypothetical protein